MMICANPKCVHHTPMHGGMDPHSRSVRMLLPIETRSGGLLYNQVKYREIDRYLYTTESLQSKLWLCDTCHTAVKMTHA